MMLNKANSYDVENQPNEEEIPLRRSLKITEKVKLKDIFDKFDLDRNGTLNIREFKRLIKAQEKSEEMPVLLSQYLLQISDKDKNKCLDFDEFLAMAEEFEWLKEYFLEYHKIRNVLNRKASIFIHEPDPRLICRLPLTTLFISLTEIGVFLYDVIALNDHLKELDEIGLNTNGPAAKIFIYEPRKREEIWRFVTYMFVHVGLVHLVGNLVIQIFLGIVLELKQCWWRIAIIYLVGVIAGSLGTSIAMPRVSLTGASGGVYALVTAFIATTILNWSQTNYPGVQLFLCLTYCTVDFSISIFNYVENRYNQIGIIAHLSGAIAGLLIGVTVLRNFEVLQWERKFVFCAITLFFILIICGASFHIFVPSYFSLAKLDINCCVKNDDIQKDVQKIAT